MDSATFSKQLSRLKSGALLLACIVATSGCGKLSNSIQATFDRSPDRTSDDFAKSEIINNGPGIADGQHELLMVVQLMNSDGSSVKLFKPTYEIVSGTGVTPSACTTSNSNGVSTCVLKSVQPGVKRVAVTNIKISLEADVVFASPGGKPTIGLASASRSQTQGSYKLSATLGNQEPGAVKKSGTYTLFGGVQGEEFSR